MKKFQIESEAGVVMGIYEAETREAAIRMMNADAGESDLDRDDGLIVREIRKYECDRDAVSHAQTGDRQTVEAASKADAREQYSVWLTECGIEHTDDDISVTLIDWEA